MPTFDIVSEVDMQEVRNAVDQATARPPPGSTSRTPTRPSTSTTTSWSCILRPRTDSARSTRSSRRSWCARQVSL